MQAAERLDDRSRRSSRAERPAGDRTVEQCEPAQAPRRASFMSWTGTTSGCSVESAEVRREFMKKLDISSLEAFTKTVEPYREIFRERGHRPVRLAAAAAERALAARSSMSRKFTGYEVVMDVFPDVIAYGILLLPKDIKDGEKRPVVVCQHGLEGRPRDVPTRRSTTSRTTSSPCRLAEQGFITFAPQNLYIFRRPVSHPSAQGQPAQEDAVLDHRPAAPADHRLAEDAAERRPGADRVLRAELRRQVGDAHSAAGEELLPVDLLGRLQRMGLEERVDDEPVQLCLDAASTRSSSSTWAARSTMPRWRR